MADNTVLLNEMTHFQHNRRFEDRFEGTKRPEGLTDEEVAWYSAQRQADIKIALKNYSKRAFAAFALFFACAIGNAWYANKLASDGRRAVVDSGNVVAVDSCNRDYVDREKFRSLLKRLKAAAVANYEAGKSTIEQRDAAVAFYNSQLDAYPRLDCRGAATILTDDPKAVRRSPTPCYPGNPRNPTICKEPAATPPQPRPKKPRREEKKQ